MKINGLKQKFAKKNRQTNAKKKQFNHENYVINQ